MISTSVQVSVEAHLKTDAENTMKCIPCTVLLEPNMDHLLTKDIHLQCQPEEVVSLSNTLPTIATTLSTLPCSILVPANTLIPTFTVVHPECHTMNTTCIQKLMPEEVLLCVEDLHQCVVVNVELHSEEAEAVDPQEKNDTETRAKPVMKSADL
jgi:hypothetical protein